MVDTVIVKLTRKQTINHLHDPGDYCLTDAGTVILACPLCARIFVCPHQVIAAEPLTLSPSVVGPESGYRPGEQVLGPCGHHFWVENGEARGVR